MLMYSDISSTTSPTSLEVLYTWKEKEIGILLMVRMCNP